MTIAGQAEDSKLSTAFRVKSKKRILAVDDNAVIRDLLYDPQFVLDCKVATAGGGAEGFKQFSPNSFDLVITDCKMPGTDCWQPAALIKQARAHTPIIMITDQGRDDVIVNMPGSDVDFLIFKPIKFDQLYEVIQASFEISDLR